VKQAGQAVQVLGYKQAPARCRIIENITGGSSDYLIDIY
jgi:hypothetical protein